MLAIHKSSKPLYRLRIGNRQVVGPSITGLEQYYDRIDAPCPAIRFKPPSPEFNALLEKEKGSWKSMTIDEKKKLYRMNYCQTFKEIEAPNFEKRKIFGTCLMLLSIPLLAFVALKKTVFPPLPETMSDEGKKKVVRWYIDARVDPIDGVSSKWDYEKNQWKEKPFALIRSK